MFRVSHQVLQWARSELCLWDEFTCELAARNGHLEVLQWAYAHGCPFDEATPEAAEAESLWRVLDWIHDHMKTDFDYSHLYTEDAPPEHPHLPAELVAPHQDTHTEVGHNLPILDFLQDVFLLHAPGGASIAQNEDASA